MARAKPRVSGEERRELLLAAAREQIARHGCHGAAAAIAREAGCSEAVLYRHFASKRDLLPATLEREIGGRIDEGRAIAPPPGAAVPDASPMCCGGSSTIRTSGSPRA